MHRKLVIAIFGVALVILASSAVILLRYSPGNIASERCSPPLGITVGQTHNQTTGNGSWIVTLVTVKDDCFSTELDNVIVEVWTPNNTAIASETVRQIADGATFMTYHDVTPPATTLDRLDYFEIPQSQAPEGYRFALIEKSQMSILMWTTFW